MKTISYRIAILLVILSLLTGPVAPVFAQEGTPEVPVTATIEPVAEEETPTVTPTETSLPVETIVPTEPVTAIETPTPSVTETIPVTPIAEVAETAPILLLTTDPAFLTKAETVNLFWSLEGISLESKSLVLQISLPEGFTADKAAGTFDQKTRILNIPVTSLEGSVALAVKKVNSDSIFMASLLDGEETLLIASVILPLFEQIEMSSDGGSIDILDGKVKVTFPEGALQEDVLINAGFPTADALPENYSTHAFELRAFTNGTAARGEGASQESTEIAQFDQPLTIEVDYSYLTLTEEQEQELFLYWYNEKTGDWNALESYRDPETKTLTAKSDHFTVFDVGVNDWDSTRLPTTDAFQVSEFTGAGTFSLPLEVPAGPGGFQPSLTLAYNSQVVDQATTKAQGSWVGMGWSLDGGGTISGGFLTVNGISTRIVQEEVYGEYHLEDENFWRIEQINGGAVNSSWRLYDTVGNQYLFENIVNPTAFWEAPYQWNLTKMVDAFGQEMLYTYAFETKTIYGESVVTATYVTSIVYPHGRYRIRFLREARDDYTAAWATDQAFHVFERKRLKWVYMESDEDGDGVFDVIRRYRFNYVDPSVDTDNIWPGVTYSAGGKALTLRSVQEYSGSGSTTLPAHTFTYDGLHLTSATNGYGGGVQFTYDTEPWSYGATPTSYRRENIAACQGSNIADGWITINGTQAVNCSFYTPWMAVTNGRVRNYLYTNNPLGVEYNIMRPGGVYKVFYNAANISGSTYQVGLFNNSGSGTNVHPVTTDGGKVVLSTKAKTADLYFRAVTGTAKMLNMGAWLMPSFYRVTKKTIIDGNTHSYEYKYTYTSPTANINHGEVEFRGHGTVGVTNPDGTYTETHYLQGEYDKGRMEDSCTYESAPVETVYGQKISCVDNAYTVVPLPAVDPANVIDHAWVYLAAQVNKVYDAGGALVGGTKTVYTYESDYGNLTEMKEYDVPVTTGSTVPYRITSTDYNPKDTGTTYITSAPARQSVTNGAANVVFSDVLYFYGGSNDNSAPPYINKLTKIRTLVNPGEYAQTKYDYDAYGNQVNVTNYTGYSDGSSTPTGAQVTSTSYDGNYHTYPTSITNALGQVTTLDYDYRLGLPLTQTDPNSAVTRVAYDAFGRLEYVYKPDPVDGDAEASPSLTISYSSSFPFTTSITQGGYAVTKTYDGMGRVTLVDSGGVKVQTEYVSATVTSQSTPFSGSAPDGSTKYTITTNDVSSRSTKVLAPDLTSTITITNGLTVKTELLNSSNALFDGHITTTTNDIWGRTIFVDAPEGPDLGYKYDEMGRMTHAIRGPVTPAGNPTCFSTPSSGNCPSSTITSLTYNYAGQKTGMLDPDMGSWSYTYYGTGSLYTQTDARTCVLTMVYDPLNRLTNKNSSGSGCGTQVSTSYTYDIGTNGIGRRTSMANGSISDSWTYDKRGRVLSATNQGYTTNYTYTNADQLLTMTYPDGEVVTHSYTPRMQLSTLSGTQSSATTNYLTSATYDNAGRIDLMTFGNNTKTDYLYNAWSTQGGRLLQLESGTTGDPDSLQDLTYTYDLAGNISQVTNSLASETNEYGYDTLDRLTSWTLIDSLGTDTELYTYDPDGNLDEKDNVNLNYSDPNHKHAATHLNGTQKYWYDANGNQIKRIVNGQTLAMSYDAENRLVKVCVDASNNSICDSGETEVATFVYDADGKRVIATNNAQTTLFIGGQYEVNTTTGEITKYYMAGASRIAVRKMIVPSSNTLTYLLGDQLGSTSLAVNASTSEVIETRYKPWGEVRYTTASKTLPTAYTFTGQYSYVSDDATDLGNAGFGLMFYNARWYDPYLNQFTQPDTIVPDPYNPQDWNRYAYARNNPVKYTDPSGHNPILLMILVIAAFTLTGDTIQPAAAPAPIDTNASDLSDLIQLGIDHTENANIVGEGLKSLQDDPSVQSAQRNIVDIITGKPEYGEQSYSLNDLSDDFTANGPTGNWYLAPFGSGRHAFWMVHTATITATDIRVSSDGTISTTWKIDDKFDYIPSEEKGFWYNLFAKTINPIYTGLLNAKEQYPTTTQWKQTIPPPMICRRCNEFIDN